MATVGPDQARVGCPGGSEGGQLLTFLTCFILLLQTPAKGKKKCVCACNIYTIHIVYIIKCKSLNIYNLHVINGPAPGCSCRSAAGGFCPSEGYEEEKAVSLHPQAHKGFAQRGEHPHKMRRGNEDVVSEAVEAFGDCGSCWEHLSCSKGTQVPS